MARERLQQEGTLEGKLKALAKAATGKGRAFFTLPEGGCCSWRCPSPGPQNCCGRTVWRACLNLGSGPHNIWHTPRSCMHLVLEQVSPLSRIGASLSASIALRHPSQRLPSIALGHLSQHPPRLHMSMHNFSSSQERALAYDGTWISSCKAGSFLHTPGSSAPMSADLLHRSAACCYLGKIARQVEFPEVPHMWPFVAADGCAVGETATVYYDRRRGPLPEGARPALKAGLNAWESLVLLDMTGAEGLEQAQGEWWAVDVELPKVRGSAKQLRDGRGLMSDWQCGGLEKESPAVYPWSSAVVPLCLACWMGTQWQVISFGVKQLPLA